MRTEKGSLFYLGVISEPLIGISIVHYVTEWLFVWYQI